MIQFSPEHWAQLHLATRRSTIRRGVRKVLPGPVLATCGTEYAVIYIEEVRFRLFKDLDSIDAAAEGYADAADLHAALANQYPGLHDQDIMTIIHIGKVLRTV